MKGIYFGSYWMGINDVVYLMGQALKDLCDLKIIDTQIYSGNKERWYREDYSRSSKRPIRWIDNQKVLELIKNNPPDFVIINSGGMSLTPEVIKILKKQKIITIGISLSDPDVFFDNGKIYSQYYDLFYTNSYYALNNLYDENINIKLLPFAAYTKLHRPLENEEKIYDVVIVGHANRERKKLIKKLTKYFKVGLFGSGWGKEYKEVHGEEHVKAINSGKIYLSFSQTAANYLNVKVGLFEAMACRVCVVTQMFEEIESYFKFGLEILGYKNDEMLVDLIDSYKKNERLRNWIANNGYNRLLQEHTWEKRWQKVLDDIKNIKHDI